MAKKRIIASGDEMDQLCALIAQETGGDTLDQLDSVRFFIDTGNLALNYGCSGKFIKGGVPNGRIIEGFGPEASGKSLIGSNIMKGMQDAGGWVNLLDCENSSNGEFMERVSHLNLKQVIRHTPNTLEKCFRKIHTATNSIRTLEKEKKIKPRPILFVFDSLTQPPCERELRENDLPENYTAADWKRIVGRQEQPGERARIISGEMRKLQSMVVDQDVTVYLINQTREKIGVLYGCASGRTKVLLADGSWMRIAKIVNQKLPVDVMSIDPKTGEVSARRVIDWHNNGKLEDGNRFLKFRFNRGFDNGRGVMNMTPNHMIFVPNGDGMKEVCAGSLKVGDSVITTGPEWLGYDQWQLVYGSILGDGSVRKIDNGRSTAALRFTHGPKQEDYLLWKRSMLGELALKVSYSKTGSVRSDSKSIPELEPFAHYRKDYLIPQKVVDNLDLLGLAIWYMDDGTYGGNHEKHGSGKSTIYAIKWKNREVMLPVFRRFGLECKITDKGYVFDGDNTLLLHRLIARYCPPCMWYKLHQSCHHLYDFEPELPVMRWVKSVGTIDSIADFDHTRFAGDDIKYDLSVEGNRTYIVGGCLVHNSPEAVPGGNSVKFYASLRFRTSAKKKIEHKNLAKFSGINMQVKNIKNRMRSPFAVSDDIKLFFEQGIDPLSGLLTSLLAAERIVPGGKGNYSVKPEYLPEGCGEYKFKAALADNRVKAEVLLACPKLIDAESAEEVQAYIDKWGSGLMAAESGDYDEKPVAFDEDGTPLESEGGGDYEDDTSEDEE